MTRLAIAAAFVALVADSASSAPLFSEEFSDVPLGKLPPGWVDRIAKRPNPNWIVDNHGQLRFVRKRETGLITYDGYLQDGTSARGLRDVQIRSSFHLAPQAVCTCGVAVRVQDARNYYLARVTGDGRLQWIAVVDGVETITNETVFEAQWIWDGFVTLGIHCQGEILSARLEASYDVVTIDMRDARFTKGAPGIAASPYAAVRDFEMYSSQKDSDIHSPEQVAKRNARAFMTDVRHYPVVVVDDRFHPNTRRPLNSALERHPASLASEYDVVVAGAGTGGCAAAIQAARLGCRVLLLEESDWIGGQMAAAGVTTMDEDSVWMKFPVRERGIYREFHESITAHYYSKNKDPYVAYYGNPQMEGGYEPRVAQAALYALLNDAGTTGAKLSKRTVEEATPLVSLRSRVVGVRKEGDVVRGVTVETVLDDGTARRGEVACKVLVDATEYGDVLPLAGVPYRVSNQKVLPEGNGAAPIDAASPIQDHTWTAIVCEYPGGVPEHLKLQSPPPGYEDYPAKRFKKFQRTGLYQWGVAAKGIKGPRDYRVYFAWRGMADSESDLIGRASEVRHTQCGFNGGNDYSVSAATCEDPAQRLLDERRGIYLTLGALYYFQHELGLNWSLAEDEGYDTPYNRAKMKALDLRSDLEPLARHLPQMPYVRESRRMIGVDTLRAADLGRYEHAKHVPHSVAMGDYFMDLDHGRTSHIVEADLDGELLKAGEPPRGGGPFQVPMEVFLPETLDGFLPAEKNFSQSRLANGATRLQPITMLTGQAVGTMAALAARRGVQPRQLSPLEVQSALLDSGSTLIQRWYADVPWGTPIWKATQLLSLYEVVDRLGPIDTDNGVPLGSQHRWGVDELLNPQEFRRAVEQLCRVCGRPPPTTWPNLVNVVRAGEARALLMSIDRRWTLVAENDDVELTAGGFAHVAADCLLSSVK